MRVFAALLVLLALTLALASAMGVDRLHTQRTHAHTHTHTVASGALQATATATAKVSEFPGLPHDLKPTRLDEIMKITNVNIHSRVSKLGLTGDGSRTYVDWSVLSRDSHLETVLMPSETNLMSGYKYPLQRDPRPITFSSNVPDCVGLYDTRISRSAVTVTRDGTGRPTAVTATFPAGEPLALAGCGGRFGGSAPVYHYAPSLLFKIEGKPAHPNQQPPQGVELNDDPNDDDDEADFDADTVEDSETAKVGSHSGKYFEASHVYTRAFGYVGDQTGHIIARGNLGGSNHPLNMIPLAGSQNQVNTGRSWKHVEHVAQTFAKQKCSVRIDITMEYGDDQLYQGEQLGKPFRPSHGTYRVRTFAQDSERTCTDTAYDRTAHWLNVPADPTDGLNFLYRVCVGPRTQLHLTALAPYCTAPALGLRVPVGPHLPWNVAPQPRPNHIGTALAAVHYALSTVQLQYGWGLPQDEFALYTPDAVDGNSINTLGYVTRQHSPGARPLIQTALRDGNTGVLALLIVDFPAVDVRSGAQPGFVRNYGNAQEGASTGKASHTGTFYDMAKEFTRAYGYTGDETGHVVARSGMGGSNHAANMFPLCPATNRLPTKGNSGWKAAEERAQALAAAGRAFTIVIEARYDDPNNALRPSHGSYTVLELSDTPNGMFGPYIAQKTYLWLNTPADHYDAFRFLETVKGTAAGYCSSIPRRKIVERLKNHHILAAARDMYAGRPVDAAALHNALAITRTAIDTEERQEQERLRLAEEARERERQRQQRGGGSTYPYGSGPRRDDRGPGQGQGRSGRYDDRR